MSHWLLKTEPSAFSYAHLERQKRAVWDGVRNNQALIHLRAMRKGDLALIYHSGNEKAIVGIASVVADPYPDPRAGDPKIVVVDIAPQEKFREPVPLSVIKSVKEFASFELVRNSRLSVMPVPAALWKRLLSISH